MQHLITADQITDIPTIEQGDAGIILKSDGTFRVFNTEKNLDPNNLSEAQLQLGQKLLGLAAALRLPELMNILTEVANDPTVFQGAVEIPRQA